jgi:two-component system chemotaxis response regulator CheB
MSESERRARVLIVDDSALVRELLTGILSADPELEVVGVAPDPIIAREKIKTLSPDVITLDVEMPHMNGIEFLERLMRLRPMPVVMISTLTTEGADTTIRALELGAIDYVAKPTRRLSESIAGLSDEIRTKVKTAAKARVRGGATRRSAPAARPEAAAPAAGAPSRFTHLDVIGIGASTGGVEAIGEVLSSMPSDAPGIVIVQHLPGSFTGRFAARLDASLPLTVTEARDGAPVLPGTVHIGRGGQDFEVVADANGRPICRLLDGTPGALHVPSIDRLFTSLSRFGKRTIGVLLTGMGRDGAIGLKAMRDAGSLTIGQDAGTSVVYGMPRAALESGAVAVQLPLTRIAAAMLESNRTAEQET